MPSNSYSIFSLLTSQKETGSYKEEAGKKREKARREGFSCRKTRYSYREGAFGATEAGNSKRFFLSPARLMLEKLSQYGDIYNFSQVAFNKALDAEELQEDDEMEDEDEEDEQDDEELDEELERELEEDDEDAGAVEYVEAPSDFESEEEVEEPEVEACTSSNVKRQPGPKTVKPKIEIEYEIEDTHRSRPKGKKLM